MNANLSLSPFHPGSAHFVIARPEGEAPSLPEWSAQNRPLLEELLLRHKAVMLRGFELGDDSFAAFVNGIAVPAEYVYRSTPRSSVAPGVYTATEYPRAYTIDQHCENAYQRQWPMKLFFHCKQPALMGGETPLSDIAEVTRSLDPAIKEIFLRKQVMYVRNYGSGVDLPWEEVFQTSERAKVEEFCRRNDIEYRWTSDTTLQTRQVRPAMAHHPRTGELLWFNQAHLFHVSSLEQHTQDAVNKLFDEDQLPRNAYYGDGSPIESEALQHIRQVFDRHTWAIPWQRNDVLMVDNMQVAHGRRPFMGPRQVLVMMGDVTDGGPAAAPA
jgi:alpha-ketoglutarate-dependent taurine dioxygenase